MLLPEALDCGWTHLSAIKMAGGIPDGASFEFLRAAAVRHSVMVCAGLTERCGDRLFNAAVLIASDGRLLLHHRKLERWLHHRTRGNQQDVSIRARFEDLDARATTR